MSTDGKQWNGKTEGGGEDLQGSGWHQWPRSTAEISVVSHLFCFPSPAEILQ